MGEGRGTPTMFSPYIFTDKIFKMFVISDDNNNYMIENNNNSNDIDDSKLKFKKHGSAFLSTPYQPHEVAVRIGKDGKNSDINIFYLPYVIDRVSPINLSAFVIEKETRVPGVLITCKSRPEYKAHLLETMPYDTA